MIYDRPRVSPLGDCYISVEFGDSVDVRLSASVIAVEQLLRERNIPGIVEMQPTPRQLGIVIDRLRTNYDEVLGPITEAVDGLSDDLVLVSRRHEIPVWYGDPWTVEAARDHGVENNLEFVAKVNGVTVDRVVDLQTSTDFWVSLVSFTPGTPLHYPFARASFLSAPKYDVPRTFTPSRSIAIGGAATVCYSIAGPGGYQMLGRAAVDIFQATPRVDWLPSDGVLIRAGDRIRYRAIGALEYERIRDAIAAGTYQHRVTEDVMSIGDVAAQVIPAA